ncbi:MULTISPECIES: type III pantothenate kinase [unclassified Paludibacterium]|uniref:type III pantothenate kinase n=1 Tax=unclassified Paludibacterium TaxID=2618429 RepID=UPI001C048B0E|nr:type III pantothenate kinase [Paludibacterium sp. B53371]BEV72846.1 hypothetical protein THUN1379_23280 [Paludibacterium sp. THUN1379]
MILLIDAGNTRIKWAVYQGEQCLAQGALEHQAIETLSAQLASFSLARAYGAAVVQPEVCHRIEQQLPCPLQWVETAVVTAGVRNHYVDPRQMGVDRWLAVLAARRLVQGDVVVASAGTALTVEALTAEGDYLGGLIMPGYRLMLDALAKNTARLDQPAGQWCDFPQQTADALASGALDAMAGAIGRLRLRLAQHTGRPLAPLLLSGGDAGKIAPLLASPCEIVDNLVLTGLLEVADKT